MDYNKLLDTIARAEADLSKFSSELLEKRINDEGISESITTNVMIAHSSLYISRISFERVCKKLNNMEELEEKTEIESTPSEVQQ